MTCKYIANDGTEFNNARDCLMHEFVGVSFDGFMFFNGRGDVINLSDGDWYNSLRDVIWVAVTNPNNLKKFMKKFREIYGKTCISSYLPPARQKLEANVIYRFNGINTRWITKDEVIRGIKDKEDTRIKEIKREYNQEIERINNVYNLLAKAVEAN